MEAYQAAVKGDAGHHAAALALAKLHLDRGEEEAGRGVCTQLLAVQPENVQAQLLMVQLLSTQVRSKQLSCLVLQIVTVSCCCIFCTAGASSCCIDAAKGKMISGGG